MLPGQSVHKLVQYGTSSSVQLLSRAVIIHPGSDTVPSAPVTHRAFSGHASLIITQLVPSVPQPVRPTKLNPSAFPFKGVHFTIPSAGRLTFPFPSVRFGHLLPISPFPSVLCRESLHPYYYFSQLPHDLVFRSFQSISVVVSKPRSA